MIDTGENFLGRHSLIGKRVTINDSGSVAAHTISTINSRKTESGEVLTFALSRLTEVPVKAVDHNDPYVSSGEFRSTPDEAVEWFVYVMLQAGVLFQSMPDDARDEVERLLKARGQSDQFTVEPAMAYYDAAYKAYADDD